MNARERSRSRGARTNQHLAKNENNWLQALISIDLFNTSELRSPELPPARSFLIGDQTALADERRSPLAISITSDRERRSPLGARSFNAIYEQYFELYTKIFLNGLSLYLILKP